MPGPGTCLLRHAAFPKRTEAATKLRIKRLQNHGVIQKRLMWRKDKEAKRSPEKPAEKEAIVSNDAELELRAKLDKRIDILGEAYDALSKAYVKLRTEHESLKDFVEANLSVKYRLDKLERNILKHKHAEGSGEAMTPLEAT